MKPNPRRLDISAYPYRCQVTTRFADLDTQWHINNVRLLEFYQEGRMRFHSEGRFYLTRLEGHRTLVAHQSVDYLGEVHHPGDAVVGVGVLRIGTTSYALGLGLFQDGACLGTSMTVLVHADKSGSVPLPDPWREYLSKNLLPEDAR